MSKSQLNSIIIQFAIVGEIVEEKEQKVNENERKNGNRKASGQMVCDEKREKANDSFKAERNTGLVEFIFLLDGAVETIANGFDDTKSR